MLGPSLRMKKKMRVLPLGPGPPEKSQEAKGSLKILRSNCFSKSVRTAPFEIRC